MSAHAQAVPVSRITDEEPKHWHNEDGTHRMTDPRTIYGPQPVKGKPGVFSVGVPIGHWDLDERAYALHLAEHEGAAPQRREGDSPRVSNLFDLIEAKQQEIVRAARLIAAIRAAELAAK